jgi:NAD(P)-dependent dehydrogenase (short-subunit alcohol dehydrogenase family)
MADFWHPTGRGLARHGHRDLPLRPAHGGGNGPDRQPRGHDVAALLTFLMSADAGYITAATYDVNGGLQIS